MGLMDRAKKLAEQAQEKLDEAQKGIAEKQGGGRPEPAGEKVTYDEHGRPIADGPPAGEAPPPSAEPPSKPIGEEGGTDANPDPFKPIE